MKPDLLLLEGRRLLATFTVNNPGDTPFGGTAPVGSLRWAAQQASQAATPSIIDFDLGTGDQTITLDELLSPVQLSNTAEPITIDGPGIASLTIDGNNEGAVFEVTAGTRATISGLEIENASGGGDGAIYDLGTMTLADCSLVGDSGAGVDVASTGSADLKGCTISGYNQYDAGGVDISGEATLEDCTLTGDTGADAAALWNSGTTTLTDCTITGNSTAFGSGGLYNGGTLTVSGCTITGNTGGDGGVFNHAGTCYLDGTTIGQGSSSNGGAIVNDSGATIDVSGCTITSNVARGAGGALYNAGTADLADCTISGNTAGSQGGAVANGPLANQASLTITDSTLSGNTSGSNGGGVFNNGTAAMVDCTIADDSANQAGSVFSADGGGVDNSGTATLTFCTISGDSASATGGGVYNGGLGPDTITLTDTIVAGNTATITGGTIGADDLAAGNNTTVDGTYDLIGTGGAAILSGDSNILGVADPFLGPLTNNGGPTETMALLAGSPAILAGTPLSGVTADQRGDPLDIPTPDIGAYQIQRTALVFSDLTSPTITYGSESLTLGGTLSGGSQYPPKGEDVAVTLDGVTQQATLAANGTFSATFDTATLPADGSPWTVTYSYTSDGLYATTSGTSTVTVDPATPTVNVDDVGGPYTADEYSARITIDGVDGASGVGLEGVFPTLYYYSGTYTNPSEIAGLTPLSATPTAVGNYTAYCDFPGSADYNAAWGVADFSITPASPTVRVSDTGGSYGTTTGASATVAGVGGSSGATLEGVGLTLAYYSGTYTTAAQLDGLTPLPSAPSAIGSYTVEATFPGSTDYTAASALADFSIVRATPVVDVADPGGTFGGTIPDANATVAPPGGSSGSSLEGVPLTLAYYAGTYTSAAQAEEQEPLTAPPTRAGAYTAVASFAGSTDYNAASSVADFRIATATPMLSITDPGGTFDGSPFPADGTVAGVVAGVDDTPGATLEGVPFSITYYSGTYATAAALVGLTPMAGAPSGGGPYTAEISFPGSDDYAGAASVVDFAIAPAPTSVAVTDLGGTYDGETFPASATVTALGGAGGATLEGVAPTLKYYSGTYTTAGQLSGLTPLSVVPTHAGAYTVEAAFPGTADYAADSAVVAFTITRATPELGWSAPSSIVFGTRLTGTQLDATANTLGQFNYTPGNGAVLDAGNGRVLSATFTPADAIDYNAATIATTIDVTPATPTLSVSAPGGTYDGSPYPATVTIGGAGASPASSLEDVLPTLTYYVGTGTSGTSLGTSPPSSPGTYTVVASFPGSPDYTAAQSSPVTFTISQAPSPSVALAPSGGTAAFGQPVSFTVTIAGGPAVPSGTVTFHDGSAPLGTVAVDASGQATLTTTSLAVGAHSITASYSGDADLLAATSVPIDETITKAGTELVLVPRPVFKKKKVTSLGLEAEVEATGSAVPTGTVTFEIAKKAKKKTTEQVLGTASLSGGAATLTVKPNQVLKKAITVVYGGNADFQSSTAATTLTSSSLKSLARPLVAFPGRRSPDRRVSV